MRKIIARLARLMHGIIWTPIAQYGIFIPMPEMKPSRINGRPPE